jgi:outer membrane protein
VKRRLFFLLLPFLWQVLPVQGQKFGYIDSEYIVGKMPAYQKANAEMERWTQRWTKELADQQTELERLERALKAEEPLLTDAMKTQRQRDIAQKEQQLRERSNAIFGLDGEYVRKRKDLMRPLLDEINGALEKVSRQKQLAVVFDKAADGLTMLYTDPRHDYSDFVLEALGLDAKSNPTAATTPKP